MYQIISSSPNPNPNMSLRKHSNASMEHSDVVSGSDVKKKQKTEVSAGNDKIVVDNRIPTLAEKDRKFLRAKAELLIRTAVSPKATVKLLGPYVPFNATQLEREILKIHEERKYKVKKFLKSFDGKITISYDRFAHDDEWDSYDYEWGSYSIDYMDGDDLNKDFVCLSAHFVDRNCKVVKWILGYYPMEYVRDEKVSVSRIKEVIHDYEIENKVSALLVPNYGGFGHKAFDCFRKWIEKKEENPINPCFFRIYCCSDLFRLMAGDLFEDMDLLLEEIRVLVGWGKMTSTNWNITLGNLQAALDMEDKNVFAEDEEYEEHDLPSDEEWIMIRTFCKLAGCIYKVAKELFEGEYSTSNVYFHLLVELKVMLNQELARADNDYFLGKAKQILKRFDKYWNKMFMVLATASVLDPRFKMKYLEFYCSKKEVNVEGSKAETVLDYLRDLYAHAASGIRPQPECMDATTNSMFFSSEEESDEEDGEECGEEKKPYAYEDCALFQEFVKFEGSPREALNEAELDSYLKEPVMKWNKDFKALEWWKEESQKYPILSRVARDILSIPISRATWYDAYVADRRECPEFVVSMKADLVNAMMCSKSWPRH